MTNSLGDGSVISITVKVIRTIQQIGVTVSKTRSRADLAKQADCRRKFWVLYSMRANAVIQ